MTARIILLSTITVLLGQFNKQAHVKDKIDTPYQFEAGAGTDVTITLQQALNQHKIVFINKSYVISNSLTIPSGGTLTSDKLGNGILKASNIREGLLNRSGTYINISYANSVSIHSIKFQPADNMVNVSGYKNSVILVSNSTKCIISDNDFNFDFDYAKGMEAVWITGPFSRNNIVSNNTIKTLGITYCENGASYNIVQKNHIINSYANALGGIGNGTNACLYNQVLNNRVENAGRMGIEDQKNVVGTLINGNIIKGTGKLPGIDKGEASGISAVAKSTVVSNNSITDARNFYIEVGGGNKVTISGNSIYDTGQNSGIFVNFLGVKGDLNKLTTIKGNTVKGCLKGIETFGKESSQYIAIDSNIIIDPVSHAINIDAGTSTQSYIILKQNNIFFNALTNRTRYGISSYTRTPSGQQHDTFVINKNVITYNSAAIKGTGHDNSLIIAIDSTTVSDNTINGYAGGLNYGVSSNGAKTQGVKFAGNIVKLAIWDISKFSQ